MNKIIFNLKIFFLKIGRFFPGWRGTVLMSSLIVMTVLVSDSLRAQGLIGLAPVQAPSGGYAVDGDAYANTPTVGIGDWFYDGILFPGAGGSLFNSDGSIKDPLMTFFLQDGWKNGPTDLTVFATSNSIDMNPILYEWKQGDVPAKNEIQNVGVHFSYGSTALGGNPKDLWCIFAGDRWVTNGDSYIDFEFLQRPLVMTVTGTTSKGYDYGKFESQGLDGGRTEGDLLVTIEFHNGGIAAGVAIHRWELVNGTFKYVRYANSNFVGKIFLTENYAQTNVPFDAFGKRYYDINQWAEGAINLTQVLNLESNPCFSLSSVFVRTRTSGESNTSQLKDFPGAPIQLNIDLSELAVVCPAPVELPPCSSLAAITSSFNNWKAGFTNSGGVEPVTIISGAFPTLPLGIECIGGVINYTYTVRDFCGKEKSCSSSFTVKANTDYDMPANDSKTVACAADIKAPSLPEVKDSCGNLILPTGPVVNGDPECEGIVTYTYSYLDKCGLFPHDWVYTFTIEYEDFEMPANDGETVDCLADVYQPAAPEVLDNCGLELIPSGPVLGGTYIDCEGTKTFTYTYKDCEGNTHDWVYTFTIEYEDFEMPANDGETVDCLADVYQPAAPEVLDNCGLELIPSGPVVGGTYVDCEGTKTFTYTYKDCEGNTHDWVYTFTIEYEDFEMPANDGETVDCLADVYQPAAPEVLDNCGLELIPSGPVLGGTYVDCEGTKTFTYTYKDCEGNTHDWVYTFTIEYEDFEMPANDGETVDCLADVYQPAAPEVLDNCGLELIPSGPVLGGTYVDCEGTKTFTYTYKDCEGNTHDWVYTFTIEYEDFEMPANDGETVDCLADVYQPAAPEVLDNCGLELIPSGPVLGGTYVDCEGTKTFTYTYKDCEGNTHDWVYTFTIEYEDFEMPANDGETVDCLADVYQPAAPEVLDNCGLELIPSGPVLGGTYVDCEGTKTFTYTYKDCEGNTHDWVYTFTIEYEDFEMPANDGETVDCLADVYQPAAPEVLDNCGLELIPSGPVLGGTYIDCEGTKTFTYTYKDCEGNTHDWVYTFTIEYEDFEMPANDGETVDCLADVYQPAAPEVLDNCGLELIPSGPVVGGTYVDCEGTKTFTYTYKDCEGNTHDWVYTFTIEYEDFEMPANDGETVDCLADVYQPAAPEVLDNCGLELIPSGPVLGGTYVDCEGTKTFTYTYKDCEGNTHDWVYTFTIEYEDFEMPANDGETVDCLADVYQPAAPEVLDNCGLELIPSGPVLGGTYVDCEGTKTFTYTYKDCEGNTHDWVYTFTIEYEDFEMPANDGETVDCLADVYQPAAPEVLDNCGLELIPSGPVLGGTYVDCEGTKTFTYTYKDCEGNTHDWVYTFTIEYEDFEMPANDGETVDCLADVYQPAAPEVLDNCGLELIPSGPVLGGTYVDCEGTKTFTYTYKDCEGNTHDWVYTFTIEYEDFEMPANDGETVDCLADVYQPAAPEVLDNCGLELIPSGPVLGGTYVDCEGTKTFTYTYKDCEGNTHDWVYTFTIEYEDFEMPANDGETVDCLADVYQPAAPEVLDNCGLELIPSGPVLGGTYVDCEGTKTFTYTYKDCEGNTHDWVYTFTIEYEDFEMPANDGETVDCLADVYQPAAPEVLDNCGLELIPSGPVLGGTYIDCEGTKTFTYTYKDCEGNTHDWVYTFTIEYEDFEMPANDGETVDCLADVYQPAAPEVLDNCGLELIPSGPVLGGTYVDCEGTKTFTYTYKDCEGNTHDWVYTFTIEYEDFEMPANDGETVDCLADVYQPAAPEVLDNCGLELIPSGPVLGGTYVDCEGTKTFTYTYKDCEGNTHDWVYTFTIEYEDFEMPANDGETVDCLADVYQPAAPEVLDNCGLELIPSGPVLGGTYVDCEGTKTFTYTYKDCEGNTHDWVYTFTIEYEDFEMPANDGETVDCLADVYQPMAPEVLDNCGLELIPSGPVVGGTYVDCEGTKTFTYTYKDCEGNTHDWVYTFTIEYEDFEMPANEQSNVQCADDADPSIIMVPTIYDNCGELIIPTGPSKGGTYVECNGTITYTWNFEDCEGNMHDWVYTFNIEDTIDPEIQAPDDYTICNDALPEYLNATWTDNCAVGGNLVAYGVPYQSDECFEIMAYTFTVTDECGNEDTEVTYVTRNFETYGECETAFAKLENDKAMCFLEDGFDRWGWTNEISKEGIYTLPIYAGAAQCDITKGENVGFVTITYSEGKITVEYNIYEGYSMLTAHVYIGCEKYPIINGDPTVAPGQFTFNAGSLYQADNLIVTFDVGEYDGPFYAIVHAVTCEKTCKCDGSTNNGTNPDPYYMELDLDCIEESKVTESDNTSEQLKFNIYPVPFENSIDVQYRFEYDTDVTIQIFNLLGVKIYEGLDKDYVKFERTTRHLNLVSTSDQTLIVRLLTSKEELSKIIISK